jgi:methionyl-tRNA formyltransferase
LETIAPEAIVVVAYGRILPAWMLALAHYGCINLHASLLPKYRGAAPIQWAVAMGETVTGNSTMLLEEGLDTGAILLQQQLPIAAEQTAADLFEVLAQAGAPLVVESLAGLADGTLQPRPQDHSQATLAPLLTREDGRMDFGARTTAELVNRWRGFQPWPGAFTSLDGKKLIAHRMSVANASTFSAPASTEPGQIHVEDSRLFVSCAQNSWLELLEIQLEGKKRTPAADFLHGIALPAGTRLGL